MQTEKIDWWTQWGEGRVRRIEKGALIYIH